MLLRSLSVVVAMLVVASSASASPFTPFVVQPGTVVLGTTDQFAVNAVAGGGFATQLTPTSGPAGYVLSALDLSLDVGSAIILNPGETSLQDISIRVTSLPILGVVSGPIVSFSISGLVVQLNGGLMTSINVATRDFQIAPLDVSLPAVTVDVGLIDLLNGSASLLLPIDVLAEFPGLPGFTSVSVVVRTNLLLAQVPEPMTWLLLAAASSSLIVHRRRATSAACDRSRGSCGR